MTVSIARGAERSTHSRQRRRLASAMTYVTRGRSRIPGARRAAQTPRGTTIPCPRSRPDDGEAKDRGVRHSRHPSRARPPGKTRRSSRAVSTAIPEDGPRPAPQPPARAACPPNARSRWSLRPRASPVTRALPNDGAREGDRRYHDENEKRSGVRKFRAARRRHSRTRQRRLRDVSVARRGPHAERGGASEGWAVSFPA